MLLHAAYFIYSNYIVYLWVIIVGAYPCLDAQILSAMKGQSALYA